MNHITVKEVWSNFAKGENPVSFDKIRPIIQSSWKRSRNYGVDVSRTDMQYVSEQELEERKKISADLIDAAFPYLHKLYKIINDDESVLTLTDADAVILEVLSSDLMKGMPSFPKEGSIHSEKIVGTNGIGTSLSTESAIQLTGAEHWLAINQNWVCSSLPIRINNKIRGCINLACPMLGKHHEHTLGLVVATVNAIEREIMLKSVLGEKQIILQQQKAILEFVDTGIIGIDSEYHITQINKQALDAFKVSGAWEFRHIDELINSAVKFSQMIETGELSVERDISVKIGNHFRYLSFTTMNINLEKIGIGTIIRVRTPGNVREMINRVSGAHAYYTFNDIISISETMKQQIRIAQLASKNTSNVLIIGESGTGKELLAQAIHNDSNRKNKPFIAINCGALSRDLIQSELFGYEGGAFTGAKSGGNQGKFELADTGTLFLDEIGELPLELQVNLLRVLQTGEVLRIGAKHPNPVDVRIIAATNRDLNLSVQNVTFRSDLFYRLNVLSINLPPLRDRKGDIKVLTEMLVKKAAEKLETELMPVAPGVYDLFEKFPWPGNIRELENVIQRAVILSEGTEITLKEIPLHMLESSYTDAIPPQNTSEPSGGDGKILDRKQSEYKLLVKTLSDTSGNLRKSALLLGVSRGTVYNMVKRHGLKPEEYR